MGGGSWRLGGGGWRLGGGGWKVGGQGLHRALSCRCAPRDPGNALTSRPRHRSANGRGRGDQVVVFQSGLFENIFFGAFFLRRRSEVYGGLMKIMPPPPAPAKNSCGEDTGQNSGFWAQKWPKEGQILHRLGLFSATRAEKRLEPVSVSQRGSRKGRARGLQKHPKLSQTCLFETAGKKHGAKKRGCPFSSTVRGFGVSGPALVQALPPKGAAAEWCLAPNWGRRGGCG